MSAIDAPSSGTMQIRLGTNGAGPLQVIGPIEYEGNNPDVVEYELLDHVGYRMLPSAVFAITYVEGSSFQVTAFDEEEITVSSTNDGDEYYLIIVP